MRLIILLAATAALGGCSKTWEDVSSPPGGTGVTINGDVEEGELAVASVTQLPTRNSRGTVDPYGTKGKAAVLYCPLASPTALALIISVSW